MKKKVFMLSALVLSLVMMLCACSTTKPNAEATMSNQLTLSVGSSTLSLKAAEEFKLQEYKDFPETIDGFLVFVNDEHSINGLIKSNVNNVTFDYYTTAASTDEDVQEVYELDDTNIYYSCINDTNRSKIEYNHFIKLNDDYVLYIGSFDKTTLDTFFESLTYELK